MKVRFVRAWRGHAEGAVVEFTKPLELAGCARLIAEGECVDVLNVADPDVPTSQPESLEVTATKPKRMRRRKRELEEPSGGTPKSAMTTKTMFGENK